MRVNVKEIAALATQPDCTFDKEGLLSIQEKHEGLFRSYEAYVERWCRLRGNLFFYFKGKNENSGPAGVYVLEECSVRPEYLADVPFSFVLTFVGDPNAVHLSVNSEEERQEWVKALSESSYQGLRSRMSYLRHTLGKVRGSFKSSSLKEKEEIENACTPKCYQAKCGSPISMLDPYCKEPFMEITLSCSSLRLSGCSSLNPIAVVHMMSSERPLWTEQGHTESLENTSNPRFLTTVVFHQKEICNSKWLKVAIGNVRERVSSTYLPIGEAVVNLNTLLSSANQCIDMSLISPNYSFAGFLKLCIVHLDPNLTKQSEEDSKESENTDHFQDQTSLLYGDVCLQTYCFQTSKGGNLLVREVMTDTPISFSVPTMLLNILIDEEKKLFKYSSFLKKIKNGYQQRQKTVMDRHMQLINTYKEQSNYLKTYTGPTYKPSRKKSIQIIEFVPVNLHLQRINVCSKELEDKVYIFDIVTVGAFAAHTHRFYKGGLRSMCAALELAYSRMYPFPLSLDLMSSTAECAYRVATLRSEVEENTRHMKRMFAQKSCGEILEAIINISNKVQKFLEHCSPSLINKVLEQWEKIYDPDARRSDEEFDAEHHFSSDEGSASGRMIRTQSGTKSTGTSSPKTVDALEAQATNCINSLNNISESSVENTDREEERRSSFHEFEPLDLIKLNIKASLMCITSKVQSLINSRRREEEGGSNEDVNIDWEEEVDPSVTKLRQSIDSLHKTTLLTYSLLTLVEDTECATQRHLIKYRYDVVLCHALTALSWALMVRFWCRLPEPHFAWALAPVGILAHFEVLLSCYGDEMGMLEDMLYAIKQIRNVHFYLEPYRPPVMPKPMIRGTRSNLSVSIPIPEPQWALVSHAEIDGHVPFSVVPVMFNVGINEQATLAERFGDVSLQEGINSVGFRLLSEYCGRYLEYGEETKNVSRSLVSKVNKLLKKLQQLTDSKKGKNVSILQIASVISRLVGGLRFTSCKSAKDRTAMGATLEQVAILQKHFNLDEREYNRALDCMRSEGTRRENARKNILSRKYAFNGLQLMTMPRMYRPPSGTYGNVEM